MPLFKHYNRVLKNVKNCLIPELLFLFTRVLCQKSIIQIKRSKDTRHSFQATGFFNETDTLESSSILIYSEL